MIKFGKRRAAAVVLLLAALLLAMLSAQALGALIFPGSGQPAFTLRQEDSHQKYMDGSDNGLFLPSKPLSRAELAQMLYGLVEQRPEEPAAFPDVPRDAWYAAAVGAMAGLGIMTGCEDGLYRPDQAVTRAECAAALSHLVPAGGGEGRSFPDVPADHWAYDQISRAAANGLFSGDEEGLFHPEAGLLRSQAATVFNTLLGRAADAEMLARADNLRIFPDVPRSHWAYSQIMEATVSHENTIDPNGREIWLSAVTEPTPLADGFYRIDGRLYQVKGGAFLHGAPGNVYTDGVFTFDENGRYTTGDQELDQKLSDIVERYANTAMTRDEKLRALYNYVRDNYTYLKRPLVEKGQTGWEPEYASFFLDKGKGNCYSFSATFALLCRQLGLPARTVVGSLGRDKDPHGWVELELDGVNYMFDPQLEWRYLHDYERESYDLFKMLPDDAPNTYIR